MKQLLKIAAASAAALFAFAVFMTTAPTVHADDYCITNGAQAAHGCGYPSMEACRAASSGIGGSCSSNALDKTPSSALAYQPKRPHSRSELRLRREPTGH